MDCSQEFLNFVSKSSFDYKSLRPWERETLRYYLGLGNDMKLMPEIKKLEQEYLKSEDFRAMCDLVRTFCENQENINACYCNIHRGVICFFFVSKCETWSIELSESITYLSIQLAGRYPDEYTDFRQIPLWSDWVDLKESTHIFGEQRKE